MYMLLTHFAIGQPWILLPSLPVYSSFSIRNAAPQMFNLMHIKQTLGYMHLQTIIHLATEFSSRLWQCQAANDWQHTVAHADIWI